MSGRLTRRELVFASVLALVLGAGPTVGDVGACGRGASDLDEARFAHARKVEDCQRCTGCGLASQRCKRACDALAASDVAFPPTCHPLLHDGEVCLRALAAASCGDYSAYVDDVAPATPSECDFCQLGDGRSAAQPGPHLTDGAAP